jgi:hypothetical protein
MWKYSALIAATALYASNCDDNFYNNYNKKNSTFQASKKRMAPESEAPPVIQSPGALRECFII